MNVVINFSHPVGSRQKVEIESRLGEVEVIEIKAQFDLDAPTLRDQVDTLIADALEKAGGRPIVAIVPPSLSSASFWVGQAFANVPAIWMTRESTLPPSFRLGNIE